MNMPWEYMRNPVFHLDYVDDDDDYDDGGASFSPSFQTPPSLDRTSTPYGASYIPMQDLSDVSSSASPSRRRHKTPKQDKLRNTLRTIRKRKQWPVKSKITPPSNWITKY